MAFNRFVAIPLIKPIYDSILKTIAGSPREAEYRQALHSINDDFKAGNASKAAFDLTFLLYKLHDDGFQASLGPLGLYKGYTDEELRERLYQDRAWATTVLLLDFAEFLPQYKRAAQKIREKVNVNIGRYKIGFAMLPDGFDPFDAIATTITLAKKGAFRRFMDDLSEGNYAGAGAEVLKAAIPPLTEEALGRLGGYEEFFGDNMSGWLMADSSEMQHERPERYAPRERTFRSAQSYRDAGLNRVREMRRRTDEIKEAYGIA